MQQLRIFVLMAGLTAFVVVIGGYFFGEGGAMLFFAFAALTNFGMYWFSDKLVLRMYKAKILTPENAPDLYQMVDRLRQRAELPMPVLALAPSEQPNAFATGRNAKHAVVCVTAGLMKLVNTQEMEGIVAHELAHIKHRHMFVSTMAATMAGAVGMLAVAARWGMIFGGRGGDDRNPIVLLVMTIVAPIAAMIIQFAISRQNEFQADRTGAIIAGNPVALASALERLESYAHRIPMDVNPAAAQLAIVNPLSAVKGRQMLGLFRTHPPTEERVARLREQARETGVQGFRAGV